MSSNRNRAWSWLCAAVLLHLVISVVHGAAHTQAHVPLSRAASLFVYVVILAGPLAGLALTWPVPRVGYAVVALSMAGALVFGVVNHFVLTSADHVGHVDPHVRTLFATTAVLLAVTEALGVVLAVKS